MHPPQNWNNLTPSQLRYLHRALRWMALRYFFVLVLGACLGWIARSHLGG